MRLQRNYLQYWFNDTKQKHTTSPIKSSPFRDEMNSLLGRRERNAVCCVLLFAGASMSPITPKETLPHPNKVHTEGSRAPLWAPRLFAKRHNNFSRSGNGNNDSAETKRTKEQHLHSRNLGSVNKWRENVQGDTVDTVEIFKLYYIANGI